MEKKDVIIIRKGREIIILSILFLIYIFLHFKLGAITDWLYFRGSEDTFDWLSLFILNCISFSVYYISLGTLLLLGIFMTTRKHYSLKSIIIVAMTIIASGLTYITIWVIDVFTKDAKWYPPILNKIIFAFFSVLLNPISWVPICYGVSLIYYFSRLEKEERTLEKKRAVGVKIFGWVEIVIGVLGIGVLIEELFSLKNFLQIHSIPLASIFNIADYCEGRSVCYGMDAYSMALGCLLFIPFPFILWAGLYTRKLKPIARKINLFIAASLLIIFLIFNFLLIRGYSTENLGHYYIRNLVSWEGGSEKIYALPIIFSLIIMYFFTRPKVKEQFR